MYHNELNDTLVIQKSTGSDLGSTVTNGLIWRIFIDQAMELGAWVMQTWSVVIHLVSELDCFHHHGFTLDNVLEPVLSEAWQTRFVNQPIGLKDVVYLYWIMPWFDLGDLNGEVHTGSCPWDGFPSGWNAPSDLVTILLTVFVIFFPQEVNTIQPAVLILPSLDKWVNLSLSFLDSEFINCHPLNVPDFMILHFSEQQTIIVLQGGHGTAQVGLITTVQVRYHPLDGVINDHIHQVVGLLLQPPKIWHDELVATADFLS